MIYISTARTTCRACSAPLEPHFDLGSLHVSSFPAMPDEADTPVPLNLLRCSACGLVQLSHTVSREQLFRYTYWYRSGVNESMIEELHSIALAAVLLAKPERGDTVIDIGANDGTLLHHYKTLGYDLSRVGFDPAANLTEELAANCEIAIPDFFPAQSYDGPPAKIITSIAMFYDLEDPVSFVREIARCLHPEGVWVCQFGDLASMYSQNAFDAICHEHLAYWSLGLFRELIGRVGLQIVGAQHNDVNGGSLRIYVKHVRAATQDMVASLLQREQKVLNHADEFPARVARIRSQVHDMILHALTTGPVDVYGASTKGNTLLQYFQLGYVAPGGFAQGWLPIRQAIERSSTKWGRYTVGSGIPIVSEKAGRENPAALWLCLPWHFKEGILQREADYLAQGGKILFPLPWPVVLEARP